MDWEKVLVNNSKKQTDAETMEMQEQGHKVGDLSCEL